MTYTTPKMDTNEENPYPGSHTKQVSFNNVRQHISFNFVLVAGKGQDLVPWCCDLNRHAVPSRDEI